MPDPQHVHVTSSSLRLDQPDVHDLTWPDCDLGCSDDAQARMDDLARDRALSGAEWRKAARAQQAAQAKAARNRRGKKPQPPITGVRRAQ